MKIFLAVLFVLAVLLVGRVGELYTQLVRYQKYWSSNNLKPVNPDDFVYIALGDSAAQGVGASTPLKGYVGLVADELRNDYPSLKIINLSKSGAKIKDVLQTQLPLYKELGLKNRQVITIEIGANDITTFDEHKFKGEMAELMAALPTDTVISDIPSFAGSRHAKYQHRVIKANKIIHDLAKIHGFKPAGLYDRVNSNHGLRTFAADLFHPSDYGYRTNWLPAFMERINED